MPHLILGVRYAGLLLDPEVDVLQRLLFCRVRGWHGHHLATDCGCGCGCWRGPAAGLTQQGAEAVFALRLLIALLGLVLLFLGFGLIAGYFEFVVPIVDCEEWWANRKGWVLGGQGVKQSGATVLGWVARAAALTGLSSIPNKCLPFQRFCGRMLSPPCPPIGPHAERRPSGGLHPGLQAPLRPRQRAA